jgi:8-oxo-dGTP pyrophosphatase MutT (NUDIX family)
MSDPTPRARVVIVRDGCIALIRRVRDGHTYFLFPGGGVEAGETPEQAAHREAVEELGVEVELGEVVHEESFGGTRFVYYDAWIVGGSFGMGKWPDHAGRTDLERARAGTYDAVWVALEQLPGLDVRPTALAAMLTPR